MVGRKTPNIIGIPTPRETSTSADSSAPIGRAPRRRRASAAHARSIWNIPIEAPAAQIAAVHHRGSIVARGAPATREAIAAGPTCPALVDTPALLKAWNAARAPPGSAGTRQAGSNKARI